MASLNFLGANFVIQHNLQRAYARTQSTNSRLMFAGVACEHTHACVLKVVLRA
jgi:hypothetical protein